MTATTRTMLLRAWDGLRTTWLILGVCLLLFVVAEAAVRVARRVSGVEYRRAAVPESYRTSDWYTGFARDQDGSNAQRWLAYVNFGRRPSYHSRTVNIDSLGRRITPEPTVPAAPAARVFFFGGSTMWGTGQRDDHTIPAEASRRLQQMVGPGRRVEVTNFGEAGYVSTQGLLKLMLQLRAGDRPDVVVFYDGINDVVATVQARVAGLTQNEAKRISEFNMGRAIDRNVPARGTRQDLHAVAVLELAAVHQSALLAWLQTLLPARRPERLIGPVTAAKETAASYAENVRIIEALSKTYGFTAIYVWQPSLHATDKVLTPFERHLLDNIAKDSFQHRLQEVHRVIPPLVDSAVAPIAGSRFVDATHVFSGDSSEVFIDRIGHNTEASVPKIVDAFWPALRAAVGARVARP